MREIQAEDAEEGGPAGFGALKLIVPVAGTGEQAMDHAHQAGASGARLYGPLGCYGGAAGAEAPTVGSEAVWWLLQLRLIFLSAR